MLAKEAIGDALGGGDSLHRGVSVGPRGPYKHRGVATGGRAVQAGISGEPFQLAISSELPYMGLGGVVGMR